VLLEGRVAVVSGIGPGMGRDISLALAGAGADLVLGARTPAALDAVAQEVEALGRRALRVPTDVTDPAQCRRLAGAAGELGRIDVLVNNAFREEDWHRFDGFDVGRWREPFDVNVFGSLQLSQSVVPHMKKVGGGSIIMITTLSIRMLNPVLGGYAASKRSLTSAAQAMARELGRDNIRVNCVAPGHIWGRSLEHYFEFLANRQGVTPRAVYEEIAATTALNHIATSEEIARVVLFFASDLSRVITGQTLDVNCGRTFD
jgi:NAD(P)-dependent dehydrogenase (short-subunit alcohol dehydrogenase family)